MKFHTSNKWDEALWLKIKGIYYEAFSESGAKPEKIIRNMFKKGLCSFHMAIDNNEAVAMALTGFTQDSNFLIIDYLAVRRTNQRKGIGRELVLYIKNCVLKQKNYDSILLEVESERTSENLNRIYFWESCGFTLLNDYIHHYIWVPEPYQAMVHPIQDQTNQPLNGKEVFKYITKFHRQSFKKETSNE